MRFVAEKKISLPTEYDTVLMRSVVGLVFFSFAYYSLEGAKSPLSYLLIASSFDRLHVF